MMADQRFVWENAVSNLRSVLLSIASPDIGSRLIQGPINGHINSEELYNMFVDFYEIVGPMQPVRYRSLSPRLDQQLKEFESTFAELVIRTDTYQPDEAAVVGSPAWHKVQVQAAQISLDLFRLDGFPVRPEHRFV